MNELESLEPARMVRMYLEARWDGLADWALKSYKYRLRAFIEWYEESDVDDLTGLDGRDLYEFRIWRRKGNFGVEDGETPEETAPVTLKSQLITLRALFRFAANIHAVPKNFYERMSLSKLSRTDGVSDSTFEPGRAIDILEYLHRCYCAPRRYAEFALLWETGTRVSAIHGLNLYDLDLDDRTLVVRYKRRPDQGTSTESGKKGERFNSVSDRADTML